MFTKRELLLTTYLKSSVQKSWYFPAESLHVANAFNLEDCRRSKPRADGNKRKVAADKVLAFCIVCIDSMIEKNKTQPFCDKSSYWSFSHNTTRGKCIIMDIYENFLIAKIIVKPLEWPIILGVTTLTANINQHYCFIYLSKLSFWLLMIEVMGPPWCQLYHDLRMSCQNSSSK